MSPEPSCYGCLALSIFCYDALVTKSDASKKDDLAAKVQAAQANDVNILELKKNIAALQDQRKEATEIASRSQAELLNAKIRMDREVSEIRKFSSEVVLLKLLPTIDNLQRALKHLPAALAQDNWVRGIVALEQEFLKQVGEMGLKRFESLGQTVDTDRHEVLMQVAGEAGKVIDVVEDGYELHGKVVRPAKVKAGSGQT